jgi:hypothetical protein
MKVCCTVVLALCAGLFASVVLTQGPAPTAQVETVWMCPMHPDYTRDAEGRCPRCGMALVRGAPFDVRDYRLEFRTDPGVVKPADTATLRFAVFHPGTNDLIRRFEVVHEKQYHLFVIAQDLQHFEHIHPEQQRDGTWSIGVTLPKAGYYKVLSDFVPGGGAAQLIARPLVTAGYAGDLIGDSTRLVADTVLTKTAGDMTATLSLDPPTFVAGLYGHLTYRLTETATGRPISDLQPYLGAFGHTLVMSEDGVSYVHAHPLNVRSDPDDGGLPVFLIPPDADLETLRGGPDVTFDGLIPKAGRYRAWTQFRRNDRVYTFAFTFEAVAAPEGQP